MEIGGSTVKFPAMQHMENQTLACAHPHYGEVVMRCDNTVVRLMSGNCIRDCMLADYVA